MKIHSLLLKNIRCFEELQIDLQGDSALIVGDNGDGGPERVDGGARNFADAESAVAGAAGVVNYTWTNNAGTGKALDTDTAVLVIYCAARQQCIYLESAAERGDQAGALTVTNFIGEVVETWIGFFSADGKEVATSIYTGQLTVN